MDFIINPPQHQMQQQFFQNQRYSFGDFDTKKITLFYSGSGTISSSQTGETLTSNTITIPEGATSSSYVTATYDSSGNFVFNLVEPIIIDKMSDVFLDNFTIYNCNASMAAGSKGKSYGIVLNFNDINQNNFSNNTTIHDGELIVLDSNASGSSSGNFIVSKNKKFNYIGIIQPGKYKTIDGKLTDIENTVISRQQVNKNLVFSIELVISNKS